MTALLHGVAARALWQMSTWASQAACTSPEAHAAGDWDAPEYVDTAADALAGYCLTCPVAGPCLDLALVLDVRTGIRGGLTPAERVHYLGAAGSLAHEPETFGDPS